MRKTSSICPKGHVKGPGKCKECRRQYNANYHQANRETILVKKAAYKKMNPEKCVMHAQSYRAKKKELLGSVSSDIVDKLKRLQKGKCACCSRELGEDFHLDHIMPLSLGGMHEDANLQLLRGNCNLRKNAKHPVDFMREKGFLI